MERGYLWARQEAKEQNYAVNIENKTTDDPTVGKGASALASLFLLKREGKEMPDFLGADLGLLRLARAATSNASRRPLCVSA